MYSNQCTYSVNMPQKWLRICCFYLETIFVHSLLLERPSKTELKAVWTCMWFDGVFFAAAVDYLIVSVASSNSLYSVVADSSRGKRYGDDDQYGGDRKRRQGARHSVSCLSLPYASVSQSFNKNFYGDSYTAWTGVSDWVSRVNFPPSETNRNRGFVAALLAPGLSQLPARQLGTYGI